MSANIVRRVARKTGFLIGELRRSRQKPVTDLYSHFGIPNRPLPLIDDRRVKVVIDPPGHYFGARMRLDLLLYDQVLLIHGCEPPEINDIRGHLIQHGDKFAKLCTFDDAVREAVPSSESFCFGSCWVTTDAAGQAVEHAKDYTNIFSPDKRFKVSFIKSHKRELPGHQLRHEIEPLFERDYPFGICFPKQWIETKIPLFDDSMFHIAIENSRHPNYFTEKIIDCFMTYTIPIYWGAPNIGDHFDIRGIITFETLDDLAKLLDSLTESDYRSRLDAAKRNMATARANYAFFFDRLDAYIRGL